MLQRVNRFSRENCQSRTKNHEARKINVSAAKVQADNREREGTNYELIRPLIEPALTRGSAGETSVRMSPETKPRMSNDTFYHRSVVGDTLNSWIPGLERRSK